MNPRIFIAIVLTLLASPAHARFAKFIHVAPGIESDRPSMPYAISTHPVLTIARSGDNTLIVTIPLKGTKQHQQYWVIRCKSSVEKERMDFRAHVWGIGKREDVESAEVIQLKPNQEAIAIQIMAGEIHRTYIYLDYPRVVEDGGYYYCYDLPAYYKKYKGEEGSGGNGGQVR